MKGMGKAGKYGLIIIALGALVLGFLFLPINRWVIDRVEWIHEAGAPGIVVYAVVYVLATVLLLPGSPLTLGAGFAYGPLWGTLLVSPVSTLAATLAFVLGRFVLRDWIARRMEAHPRFAAIDRAVGLSGFKIILLLRLSPIFPFNLLNYALGLTRVKLFDYMLASLLGMLPGTILYVYLGSLVTSASELASGQRPSAGTWGQALYWGGLVATLVVTVIITRVARRALREALEDRFAPAPEQRGPRHSCQPGEQHS